MVGWRITLWAALVLVALLFLYAVRSILAPFVLAFLISALLDPTIRRLRMRGYSRLMSVGMVFVAFFGLITLIGVWLTPVIAEQLTTFRDRIETFSSELAAESQEGNYFVRWTPEAQLQPKKDRSQLDMLYDQASPFLTRFNIASSKQEFFERYIKPHQEQLTQSAQGFFNSLIGVLGAIASQLMLLIFTPIFALLILMDMDRFKKRSASWIPPAIRAGALDLLSDIGDVFIKYMRGVSIVVFWYVVVAGILLTALGAPYAILLAVLFSLIYLLPMAGPVLNLILLIIITGFSGQNSNMLVSFPSSWVFGIVIGIIYFVAMFFFDQLVYARVVGGAVGLHPVASFFCIFAGAALFGAVGMLLAFPLAGSIKVILDRLLRVTSSKEGTLSLPSVPLRHRPSQS
jgi:predicted PurR-regulated permease PerM